MNLRYLIHPLLLTNAALVGFCFAREVWVVVGLGCLSIALDLTDWVLHFKTGIKRTTP